MSTPEISDIDKFSDLLVEAHVSSATATALAQPESNYDWLATRHDALTQRIVDQITANPDMLDKTEFYEKARIAAALGMLAFVPGNETTTEPNELKTALFGVIGKSTLALQQIEATRAETIVDPTQPIEAPAEKTQTAIDTDHPEAITAEETLQHGLQIEIDVENSISINGEPIDLLPAQRVVFDYILDSDEPFRLNDIYKSEGFQLALKETNQTSPPPSAFANAYRGLESRLKSVGATLEDFVTHIGGGPHSRMVQRNRAVNIVDKKALAEVDDLAHFLFDQMDFDNLVSIKEAAQCFFEVNKLSARHQPAIDRAVEYLIANLEGPQLKIERENGSLALKEVKAAAEAGQGEDQEQEPDRGEFIEVNGQFIKFENATFEFTHFEQVLMSVLLGDVQFRKGITRRHLENFLSERKIDAPSFDSDFAKLLHKLGPQIKRQRQNRKTRYFLNTKPAKRRNPV